MGGYFLAGYKNSYTSSIDTLILYLFGRLPLPLFLDVLLKYSYVELTLLPLNSSAIEFKHLAIAFLESGIAFLPSGSSNVINWLKRSAKTTFSPLNGNRMILASFGSESFIRCKYSRAYAVLLGFRRSFRRARAGEDQTQESEPGVREHVGDRHGAGSCHWSC